jgi:hypothetical protein
MTGDPILALTGAVFGALFLSLVGVGILRGRPSGVIAILVVTALNRPLANLLGDPRLAEFLQQFDDICLALAIVCALISGRSGWRRMPIAIWVGFGIFALSGLAGDIVEGVTPAVWLDGLWLALKLPLTILALAGISWTESSIQTCRNLLSGFIFACAVISMVEFMSPDVVRQYFSSSGTLDRFGLISLKGFFEHPAQAATFYLFALCFMVGADAGTRKKLTQVVAVVLTIMSLRVKAIIDVLVILFLRVATSRHLLVRATIPAILLAAILGSLLGGSDVVESRITGGANTSSSGLSPRQSLYSTSFQIARDHLPFGVGFGRFGSQTSADEYSPVYVEYGLADNYGFTRTAPIYVKDAGWATVLGESGAMGFVAFAYALVHLWLHLWSRVRQNLSAVIQVRQQSYTLGAWLFMTVFLIDSLASPRIFDGLAAVALAILLGMAAPSSSSARSAIGLNTKEV